MKITHALVVKSVNTKDLKAKGSTDESVRGSLGQSGILQKPQFFLIYEC